MLCVVGNPWHSAGVICDVTFVKLDVHHSFWSSKLSCCPPGRHSRCMDHSILIISCGSEMMSEGRRRFGFRPGDGGNYQQGHKVAGLKE